jgi:hypothetical protein
MNHRDPLQEHRAASDENSLGNLLLRRGLITKKQLRKALSDSATWKAMGIKKNRLGDALEKQGISRELIEQIALEQVAERLRAGESSTHITAQMATSNVAQTERVTARAIALATPTKQEPDR